MDRSVSVSAEQFPGNPQQGQELPGFFGADAGDSDGVRATENWTTDTYRDVMGPPCVIIAGLGGFGSGDWANGVAMPNKKTCPGGQVFLKSRLSRRHRRAGGEAFTFDLGQFHMFSFQAAGLGTGRTLPVVGLFQLAMSFCHDFKS